MIAIKFKLFENMLEWSHKMKAIKLNNMLNSLHKKMLQSLFEIINKINHVSIICFKWFSFWFLRNGVAQLGYIRSLERKI